MQKDIVTNLTVLYTTIRNIMRIILLSIVALIGLNIASQSIDKVDKMQQERIQQYCQIDPTMCNQS